MIFIFYLSFDKVIFISSFFFIFSYFMSISVLYICNHSIKLLYPQDILKFELSCRTLLLCMNQNNLQKFSFNGFGFLNFLNS